MSRQVIQLRTSKPKSKTRRVSHLDINLMPPDQIKNETSLKIKRVEKHPAKEQSLEKTVETRNSSDASENE